jgi:hypothetical protein
MKQRGEDAIEFASLALARDKTGKGVLTREVRR